MKDSKAPITGARPYFPEEDLPGILEDIGQVLRGGRLILGQRTRDLEAAWAKRVGTAHAVALSSCTAALEIALRAADFSDMSPDDYCADVDDLLGRMTADTAAVIVVHIAGFISKDIDRLRNECRARKVKLIEDCAHAHGSTWQGREAGSLADVGCFSLYPTKVLTCGVGGVLTTDDAAVADLARSLRHHGQGSSLEEIVHAGNDWMMDEVRAVLSLAQLRRLDGFLEQRRAVAARYDALLADSRTISLPRRAEGMRPAYYKYPVQLPEAADRDAIRRRLHEEHGIEAGTLYSPPCHLMPVFRNLLGTGPGQLPQAERALQHQLCLPMHALVTDADAVRSVAALDQLLA